MSNSNSINILTDLPELEKPTKEFKNLTKIICNIIEGSKPEFTIGIYGQWGTGKTTLMQNVQKMLSTTDYNIPTVWFNAWRYEQEQVLATMPLVATILDALTKELENKTKKEHESQSEIEKAKRYIIQTAKAFVKGSSVSVKGEVLGNGVEYAFDASKIIDQMNAEKEKITDDVPTLHKGIQLIGEILVALDNEQKRPKLVVFIDDLDRCSLDTTMAVFESVKILLNMKGIIHVMGISKDTIGKLIKEKFKTHEINDDEYIQKIIQLPIALPDWKQENIKTIVSDNIMAQLGKESIYYKTFQNREGLLTLVAQSNPREAKRIVNQFIVDYEFTKMSYPEIFSLPEKELEKKRFSIFVISLLRILEAKNIVNILAKNDADSITLLKIIEKIRNAKNPSEFDDIIAKWLGKMEDSV